MDSCGIISTDGNVVTADSVRLFVLAFHPPLMWSQMIYMLVAVQPIRELSPSFVLFGIPFAQFMF